MMTFEKRQKLLAKEKIEMRAVGKTKITKEDELRGLKDLIKCIRHFEDLSEEELDEMYKEGLEEINKKYGTQKK